MVHAEQSHLNSVTRARMFRMYDDVAGTDDRRDAEYVDGEDRHVHRQDPSGRESGATRSQPALWLRPGTKKDATISTAANGNSPKCSGCSGAKRMSGAPKASRPAASFVEPDKAA